MRRIIFSVLLAGIASLGFGQNNYRQTELFDANWKFKFGHPTNAAKDYNTGTSYFTYLAKAGYGDGASAADFDDRAWRSVDLPHDWAVELPFNVRGSHSHGYKAVGRNFPDASVGWYRKTFVVDKADFGKQIFLDFDGVSRDARVWVNGHYLGNEPSGYQSFSFNITDILNYGSTNVVAVRADVSMEEGWYYEGAGIYRHVWLRKTPALHVPKDGTFVYSRVTDADATVSIETEVENRGPEKASFSLHQLVLDAEGNVLAETSGSANELAPMGKTSCKNQVLISDAKLWSIENPYLHTLVTQIKKEEQIIDEYQTQFGIRTIRFDAGKGFFLNGKSVKLKGTNNHQDHAGVGTAMPDELIRWRLQQLKKFGSNAIRSSHNPPTPELLSLCDEMGILVINENRLMGSTDKALHELERLIKRDRNHPSVIVWSVGNEEWTIEGNEIGARITKKMQNYAKIFDSTRPVNVAISGGWGSGISTVVEIMGYNYLMHGSTDEHHLKFPDQPSIGTEEGSTFATRGIYFDDKEKHYMAAYDRKPYPDWFSIEEGWKHYAERDYLAGMFIWTGFDYRGEPTPYAWPSVTSYFGMMDLCGFPKDNVYYLKSWWQNKPVLHLLPHWNWQDKEGEDINVWVYSNCEEVELFLNEKSYGKQSMKRNAHLEWKVPWQSGTLKAVGYNNGQIKMETVRVTTGEPESIQMTGHKQSVKNDSREVVVISVQVLDKNGNAVPTANQDISFTLNGPGKIIGVGNGNPTSLEKEKFTDEYSIISLPEVTMSDLNKEKLVKCLPELTKDELSGLLQLDKEQYKVLTATFNCDQVDDQTRVIWYYKQVATMRRVYLNGKLISDCNDNSGERAEFTLEKNGLKQGENRIVILGMPLPKKHQWDTPNKFPGDIQIMVSAEQWHRQLFNGLAQVIIQPANEEGEIILKASSPGLKPCEVVFNVEE